MTFEEAVRAAPSPIRDAYQPGKQALKGEYRNRVTCADSRRLTGSIALEDSLHGVPHPVLSNPWDYGLGFRETDGHEAAIWVEVHPASTSEVVVFINKYKSLVSWLRSEARDLAKLSGRRPVAGTFFWLATETGVHIPSHTKQARILSSMGLKLPRTRIDLT